LQGYGLPSENGRGRLLVEVRQKYPGNIDSNEEKLLKKLKQSKNFGS
jgi:DnaJ-class molecular chaperone